MTEQRMSLIKNGLLLGGLALLLYILSRMSFPGNWIILFRTCSQFQAVWARQGWTMLLPFSLLVAQSLVFVVAWVLFIWIVVQQLRVELGKPVASTLPRITPDVETKPKETLKKQEDVDHHSPVSLSIQQARGNLSDAIWRRRNHLPTPKMAQISPSEHLYPQNPFDQGRDRTEMPPKPSEFFSSLNGVTPLASDPFAVKEEQPEVFQQIGGGSTPDPEQASTHIVTGEIISMPYTFGNPFEGDLPEVFQYDSDLQQALEEIQADIKKERKTILNTDSLQG